MLHLQNALHLFRQDHIYRYTQVLSQIYNKINITHYSYKVFNYIT